MQHLLAKVNKKEEAEKAKSPEAGKKDDDEEDSSDLLAREATSNADVAFGKIEQKMTIAKEMLNQGMDTSTVAKVTGLSVNELKKLKLEESQKTDSKVENMTSEEIGEVIRLVNGGPELITKESELTHKLLEKLKNSFLQFSAAQSRPISDKKPKDDGKETYEVMFKQKPLGMSWNQTSDGKNLYVQDVAKDGSAQKLSVTVGSIIHSFNGEVVLDLGPERIYEAFKKCKLPIKV
eukprot:UN30633